MLFESMKAYLSESSLACCFPLKALVVEYGADQLTITDDNQTTLKVFGKIWRDMAKQLIQNYQERSLEAELQINLINWKFSINEDMNGQQEIGINPLDCNFSLAIPEDVMLMKNAKSRGLLVPITADDQLRYLKLKETSSRI